MGGGCCQRDTRKSNTLVSIVLESKKGNSGCPKEYGPVSECNPMPGSATNRIVSSRTILARCRESTNKKVI